MSIKNTSKAESIRVFNDKVALTELGFAIEGEILLPKSLQEHGNFRLGKSVAIGNGTRLERQSSGRILSYPGKMYVNVGDAVIFQIPPAVTITSSYRMSGSRHVNVIVQDDCMARLKPNAEGKYVAALESFETLGDWVLLTTNQIDSRGKESIILIPDNVLDVASFRFTIVQLGTGGDWTNAEFKVGDSAVIERSRVMPITLRETSSFGFPKDSEFFFISRHYLLGILEPGEEASE